MLWNNLVRLLVSVTYLETCFCNNIAEIGHATGSGYRAAAHTEFRAMQTGTDASKQATGRIFFDAIGGWIMGSDYFPIEVNVPDTISTIGDGFGSMWSYLSGSVTSIYSNLVGGAEEAAAVNSVQAVKKVKKKKSTPIKRKVVKKKPKVKAKKKNVKKSMKAKKRPPKKFKKVTKKPSLVKNKRKPKN